MILVNEGLVRCNFDGVEVQLKEGTTSICCRHDRDVLTEIDANDSKKRAMRPGAINCDFCPKDHACCHAWLHTLPSHIKQHTSRYRFTWTPHKDAPRYQVIKKTLVEIHQWLHKQGSPEPAPSHPELPLKIS